VDVSTLLQQAGGHEWAQERRAKYRHELGCDDPSVLCLPFGPRASLTNGFAAKFVQTPQLIIVLYEDMNYRQIFLDGRDLPADPNPAWMGYSVGRTGGGECDVRYPRRTATDTGRPAVWSDESLEIANAIMCPSAEGKNSSRPWPRQRATSGAADEGSAEAAFIPGRRADTA
jgi:hypothetical protein